jgi:hypothetical protein
MRSSNQFSDHQDEYSDPEDLDDEVNQHLQKNMQLLRGSNFENQFMQGSNSAQVTHLDMPNFMGYDQHQTDMFD